MAKKVVPRFIEMRPLRIADSSRAERMEYLGPTAAMAQHWRDQGRTIRACLTPKKVADFVRASSLWRPQSLRRSRAFFAAMHRGTAPRLTAGLITCASGALRARTSRHGPLRFLFANRFAVRVQFLIEYTLLGPSDVSVVGSRVGALLKTDRTIGEA